MAIRNDAKSEGAVAQGSDGGSVNEVLPVFKMKVKGLRMKIPTNYDGTARKCTGEWDGEFKIDWTANPAWILRDLLTNTNPRFYNLHKHVTVAMIDKRLFYEKAAWCDVIEFGQPRFTIGMVISTQEEARQLAIRIATRLDLFEIAAALARSKVTA